MDRTAKKDSRHIFFVPRASLIWVVWERKAFCSYDRSRSFFAVMTSSEVMPSKSFALCVTSGTAWRAAQAAIQASFGSIGWPLRVRSVIRRP